MCTNTPPPPAMTLHQTSKLSNCQGQLVSSLFYNFLSRKLNFLQIINTELKERDCVTSNILNIRAIYHCVNSDTLQVRGKKEWKTFLRLINRFALLLEVLRANVKKFYSVKKVYKKEEVIGRFRQVVVLYTIKHRYDRKNL